jgi:hypothetical protein
MSFTLGITEEAMGFVICAKYTKEAQIFIYCIDMLTTDPHVVTALS